MNMLAMSKGPYLLFPFELGHFDILGRCVTKNGPFRHSCIDLVQFEFIHAKLTFFGRVDVFLLGEGDAIPR